MKDTFVHTRMEIVGIEEDRPIDAVKNASGTMIGPVPGKARHWLVVAIRPNGETLRAEVSDADRERLIGPLLPSDAASALNSVEIRAV